MKIVRNCLKSVLFICYLLHIVYHREEALNYVICIFSIIQLRILTNFEEIKTKDNACILSSSASNICYFTALINAAGSHEIFH